MSAYRDALTKLFLKGSFVKGDALQSPRNEKSSERSGDAPPRARQATSKSRTKRPLRQPQVAEYAPSSTPDLIPAAMQDKAHPGMLLAGKLRAHGKTASDLARDMRVPVNRVTAIINGQRGVTADTALRFGHWFDETPESWLDAQQRYELARARAESGGEIRRLPRLIRPR
jgi:addiction module HigA family antidote